jgi:hypothetical protein
MLPSLLRRAAECHLHKLDAEAVMDKAHRSGDLEGGSTNITPVDQERGAIGYIVLWLMGVPASLLFLFFLMRGCT